jgi:hypothetical protein
MRDIVRLKTSLISPGTGGPHFVPTFDLTTNNPSDGAVGVGGTKEQIAIPAAAVMLCKYCDGLTLDKLLDLAKFHEADDEYIFEDFPKGASLSSGDHPSFTSGAFLS